MESVNPFYKLSPRYFWQDQLLIWSYTLFISFTFKNYVIENEITRRMHDLTWFAEQKIFGTVPISQERVPKNVLLCKRRFADPPFSAKQNVTRARTLWKGPRSAGEILARRREDNKIKSLPMPPLNVTQEIITTLQTVIFRFSLISREAVRHVTKSFEIRFICHFRKKD